MPHHLVDCLLRDDVYEVVMMICNPAAIVVDKSPVSRYSCKAETAAPPTYISNITAPSFACAGSVTRALRLIPQVVQLLDRFTNVAYLSHNVVVPSEKMLVTAQVFGRPLEVSRASSLSKPSLLIGNAHFSEIGVESQCISSRVTRPFAKKSTIDMRRFLFKRSRTCFR